MFFSSIFLTTASSHPNASKWPSANIIEDALAKVPEQTRVQAYSAYLGFTKTLMKRYRLTLETVVEKANEFAASLGFDEPPPLPQSMVSKMGLKGVPGLVIEGRGLVRAHAPTGRTGGGRGPHGRKPDPRAKNAHLQRQRQGSSRGDRGGDQSASAGPSSKPRVPRESLGTSATEEPMRKKPRRVAGGSGGDEW